MPQGPPALQEVVLEEYDTRNGREQRVRVGGPDGLVYKRKVSTLHPARLPRCLWACVLFASPFIFTVQGAGRNPEHIC